MRSNDGEVVQRTGLAMSRNRLPLEGKLSPQATDEAETLRKNPLAANRNWLSLWESWRGAPERARMLTESRYTAMGTSLGQSDSIAVSMALTLPGSPSQSKPDGFASSPKGGATGVPVAALRTEQCLNSAGTAVLRSHWQQQLRQGFVESSCESR